jgi:hypothetical protein
MTLLTKCSHRSRHFELCLSISVSPGKSVSSTYPARLPGRVSRKQMVGKEEMQTRRASRLDLARRRRGVRCVGVKRISRP